MARSQPHESIPPYALTEQLRARTDALGLQSNLEDMERDGYTVVRDAAPMEVIDGIREAIIRLSYETVGPLRGLSAALLLGRDPVFEKAVLNPKVLAMVEFMCGQGAALSWLIGSRKPQGSPSLVLHSDQFYIPSPLPPHNQLLAACWALEDFTEAGGATKVVPGSHKLRRMPSPEEAQADVGSIPIECPKGSIVFWDGSVWHGNCPRTLPGERVVLHMSFSRQYVKPMEDYSHLPQSFINRHPPEMATLLGRDSAFGSTTLYSGGSDPVRLRRTWRRAQSQFDPREEAEELAADGGARLFDLQ